MTVRTPKQGGDGYASLLAELKERIRTARLKAGVAVNEELILLYWSIGRDILDRQTAAGWGARVIDRLAADLRRGLSGDDRTFPSKSEIYEGVRGGVFGARNRATGCCTIALGPRHQARREREEPRATNLVRPASC